MSMKDNMTVYYYCRTCGNAYHHMTILRTGRANSETDFSDGTVDLCLNADELLKSIMEHRKKIVECSLGNDGMTCPVCGSRIEQIGYDAWGDTKEGGNYHSIHQLEKDRIAKEVEKFVESAKEEALSAQSAPATAAKPDVKTFLQHLISIEAGILDLAEQLKPLMLVQEQASQCALRDRLERKSAAEAKLLADLKRVKGDISTLSVRYPILSLDVSPRDLGMTEPVAPVPKSSNIFNRSRIQRENEAAAAAYQKELAEFQRQFEEKKATEIARRKSANEENKRLGQEEEARLNRELESLNAASAGEDAGANSELAQTSEALLAEISETQAKIRKLCAARAQFHARGVIYPKYLDFIAITTIYEYLETGRCVELAGPDGAYNLYESEIRANRVIAQLDQVINSLDQIKQNQYYTYTLLSDMRKGISGMTEQLYIIGKHISEIEVNTALTAYNTERTAHYAKINADMTNALGFLIALK